MALDDALRAVDEHFDDVAARLDEPGRIELAELVESAAGAVGAADDRALTLAALTIVELVLPVLPVGHPVERAIAAGVRSSGAATVDLSRSILALQAHLIRTAVDPDELWQRARGRLLAAPNLTAAQVRSAGQDPGRADLIRLSDADGRIRLPAFQFDAAGCPLRLVLEINHTLDADGDPWGAADWWLCPNAWLSAVPCEVLGIVDDELLRATARAEVGV